MQQLRRQSSNIPLRALVVDDSTTLRRLMELTLSPFGIELDFADTGEYAVALAKANPYDIIFLDVMLPGMDGYRACKAIKADKRTKDTPVVMLTSMNSAFDKVRGIMAGTSVYLTKPLDRNQLMQAIDKCVPHARINFSAPVGAAATHNPNR
jgi:two-component system, cell cycle response regulator